MTRSEPRTKKLALVAAAGVLLLIIGAVARFSSPSQGSVGDAYGVARVTDLVQRVTIAGTIIPKKRAVLMPPYAGYIKKIYMKVGDKVKAGDPIISIVQSLNAPGEVYPMRAPFPGTVMQVLKTEGEWVDIQGDNNTTMVRIDDTSQLFVTADAPEVDMVKIKVGQEVVVKASAVLNKSYQGVVREISLAARESKNTNRASDKVDFPIRIEVLNKDEELKPGMSALVDVIAAKRAGVLALRHEYIQKSGDQYFVLLEGGKKRNIEVGLQNEEMFEVTKGLSEGERVLQTDYQTLSEEQNAGH